MDNFASGKLLICFFLLLSHLRIFFTRQEKNSGLCLLSPIAFIIALLDFLAYGANIFSVALCMFSFLALVFNVRALIRFFSSLYVDKYSVVFVVFSVFMVLCSLALAVAIFYFSPVRMRSNDFGVSEKEIRLSGSMRSGFAKSNIFEFASGYVTVCEPVDFSEKYESPIVLVLPDKRGDTNAYRPYMLELSKLGYTVAGADFYTDELDYLNSHLNKKLLRRLAFSISSLRDSEFLKNNSDKYMGLELQEISALMKFIQREFGTERKLFFVADGMTREAAKNYAEENKSAIEGVFIMNDNIYYKTSGFGLVEQTDPLVAKIVFNLPRDANLSVPEKLAADTDEYIKNDLAEKMKNIEEENTEEAEKSEVKINDAERN